MTTIDDLKAAVESGDKEMALVTGLELREAAGESRLKANARDRVADRLAQHGLIALPEVPWDQNQEVYLVRVGSPADLLHRAFEAPSKLNMGRVAGSLEKTSEVVGHQDAIDEALDLLEEVQDLLGKVVGDPAGADQRGSDAARG